MKVKINSSLFSYILLVMYVKIENYNNTIIVYIYDKKYINNDIEDMIKNILNILKEYYNINITNSYDLNLYINKYYGMILEINKKNINSINNIVNIDLKLLKDTLFLYEVDDPLDYIDNEIYYYNNKYYINLKKININTLENSNIVYGREVYKIIGKGIKLWYN